jgi:hypothetical protein
MLTADLSVTDNAASQTLPGGAGALTFAQVTGTGNSSQIVRRVAATSNSTPQTLTIGHELKGVGFNARVRTLVKADQRHIATDIADTGGVTPSASVYLVIDRPVQSGGAITDQIIKNLVGQICAVVVTTGQLAKLLNQEA